MGSNHDILANKAGKSIISKIVDSNDTWGQIFSNNIQKVGDWGWPRPDYVCYDFDLNQSIAFEFKPPGQSKREYITGLGQSIAYLGKHDYSGLIVPEKASGFRIAEYLSDILSLEIFSGKYTSVISYDEVTIHENPSESIRLLNPIADLRTGKIASHKHLTQTYWCWWRDISQYEVFQLLSLLDKYSSKDGDIYTDYAWPKFWELMVHGLTENWEDNGRNITDSETNKRSYKQNSKIPLFQLGLIEQSEGRLTSQGYRLLAIGKIFGVKSSLYIDYLTKLVLIEGKHLTLIKDLEDFKNLGQNRSLDNQEDFRINFEAYLNANNSIGRRKPGRETTGNKISYIRDEFKLWRKLNLIHSENNRYFFKGRGLKFDWSRITDILTKNFEI